VELKKSNFEEKYENVLAYVFPREPMGSLTKNSAHSWSSYS